MNNKKRSKIRRNLLGIETNSVRTNALIREIREILDEDEEIQRNAKLHSKRNKKNGRFKKGV